MNMMNQHWHSLPCLIIIIVYWDLEEQIYGQTADLLVHKFNISKSGPTLTVEIAEFCWCQEYRETVYTWMQWDAFADVFPEKWNWYDNHLEYLWGLIRLLRVCCFDCEDRLASMMPPNYLPAPSEVQCWLHRSSVQLPVIDRLLRYLSLKTQNTFMLAKKSNNVEL